MLSSHPTSNLDRGVRRLLAMWVFVKRDLELAFAMLDPPTSASGGGGSVSASIGGSVSANSGMRGSVSAKDTRDLGDADDDSIDQGSLGGQIVALEVFKVLALISQLPLASTLLNAQ